MTSKYLPKRGIVSIGVLDENEQPYGLKQIENKLRTSSMDYLYDIAEGNVPDHEAIRRFGYNPNGSTAWETVHTASALLNYLTAAERLQIVSDDTDDDGAPLGNGARTVLVSGLDAAYDRITETVTMNGTTNVLTDASFLRVTGLTTITAGSTAANEGTITASNNADDTVLKQMEVGENNALCAAFTVPNGYTFYVVQAFAAEASTKGSQFALYRRLQGGLWTIMRRNVLLDSAFVLPALMPMSLPEKTDIEIRCKAILAGAIVTAGFEGWIEK